MSENLAGVYDGVESVNGRVNGLTNEIQGAFARFFQMTMTEMRSNSPPAMAHNPAPEMLQAGLARESEERVAAQSPLPTLQHPKPSVPAAIPNFSSFPEQYGGGRGKFKNDRNRRDTTIPAFSTSEGPANVFAVTTGVSGRDSHSRRKRVR